MIEKEPTRKTAIVFYQADAQSAKDRVYELKRHGLKSDAPGYDVRLYSVDGWNGSQERADYVVIMPDVQGWHRTRIERAFGDRIVEGIEERPAAEPSKEPAAQPTGDPVQPPAAEPQPEGDGGPAVTAPPLAPKKPKASAVMGAGGKWYLEDESGAKLEGPFANRGAALARAKELES